MKNRIITSLTVSALLSSACTPQNKTVIVKEAVTYQQQNSEAENFSSWEKFQQLLQEHQTNLPLAEVLVNVFREQSPDVVVKLRQQIQDGSLNFSNTDANQWNELKKTIVVGESTAITDNDLLSKTLNLNLTEVERSNAFRHQLDIKISGLVQSLALQNLLKVYDEQIKLDSNDIAADLVKQLQAERPEIVSRIDSTKETLNRSAQIEQIVVYLKQADYLFLKYEISDSDAEKMIVYTAVAGALANVLAQQPSIKHLIKASMQVKDLVDKANRVVGLTTSLKKYGEELSANGKVMANSVDNIYDKIKKLSDDLDRGSFVISDKGQKSARRLLNDLLNGKAQSEVSQDVAEELKTTGFFERKRELDHDVNRFITSADTAAKSLDNILLATSEVTKALGVKLDPKVNQAINTAAKISKGIQVVNAVAKAYSAGGFVGALAAFSGGPATMALAAFGGGLGGGGPDPAIMAELAAIKQSLAEIKAMQREILENQKKMMVMIKDLALMMEEYHREEMRALSDIRDEVLNAKEGLTELDEAAFRSCEAMTAYALNKVPNAVRNLNSSNVDIIKATIREVTASPKGLKQFIINGSPANFTTCQQQMSTVFMTKDMLKFNRAAWVEKTADGKVDRNGGTIVREFYDPAFSFLEKNTETHWQHLGLHLPVLTVSTLLQKKIFYLNQKDNEGSLEDLKYLTATNKLEKFVSALLILHPYLAIDQSLWVASVDDVLKAAISDNSAYINTHQMLANAFERVQIAIAQESLLAGEPLLPKLSLQWGKIMGEKTNCETVNDEEFCFVRKNQLMMGNLLTYMLVKGLGFGQDSEEAMSIRRSHYMVLLSSPERLAQFLMLPVNRIQVEDGVTYLRLSEKENGLRIAFPDVETVEKGQIQYTEAMARMIRLQHKVADELVKISPMLARKLSLNDLAVGLFVK